jgi:DNA-binding NarL/FixJ family response regulator
MNCIEKIIIADDHPLFRQALITMLKGHFSQATLLEAETIAQLDIELQNSINSDIDLILLDLDIPGAQGFGTLINLRSQHPEIGVVIISGIDDPDTINKAMHHGAAGFIPKSTPVASMVEAIEKVFTGELWTPSGGFNGQSNEISKDERIDSLTPQQHKILLMFADGMLNKQIAYELGLAESTIKSHASTIFLKLGVRNRTQAVIVLNEITMAQNSFGPTV